VTRHAFRVYSSPCACRRCPGISWRWECTLCQPAARGRRHGPDAWNRILAISLPRHFRVRYCHHRHNRHQERTAMAAAELDLSQRHPQTQHLMKWLVPNPRLDGIAADVAILIYHAATDLVTILGDGPELSAGLRKLREAKDCLVIQGLDDSAVR
jgi:hypothetical protein